MRVDSGYTGLNNIHPNTLIPKKKSKNHPLTKEDKRNNKALSSNRVSNEHVIGRIKRFKIVSDRYRNRRKRFGLRFNLIAGICNYELSEAKH
jgi:DDE superfamily endonuclease